MQLTVNGKARPLPARASVLALIQELGLEGKRIAVEVNGEVVPRSRYEAAALKEGDRIEIVGAVGGG